MNNIIYIEYNNNIIQGNIKMYDTNHIIKSSLIILELFQGGMRKLLYEMTPYATIYIQLHETYGRFVIDTNPYIIDILKNCVYLSNVIKFKDKYNNIYFGMLEFSELMDILTLDLFYFSNEDYFITNNIILFKKIKNIIIWDLDNTLYLCDENIKDKTNIQFDFNMSGLLSITKEPFHHSMIIRSGAHKVLYTLSQLPNTELYVSTAGDIHYARMAVMICNKLNWNNSTSLLKVEIPLLNLFSVRNNINSSQCKTILQLHPFYIQDNCNIIIVDDNIDVWCNSDRDKIVHINMIDPRNNNSDELLRVLDIILQKIKL